MFYVFSFPPGVYVGTLSLIASIPGPSILALYKPLSKLSTRYFFWGGGGGNQAN